MGREILNMWDMVTVWGHGKMEQVPPTARSLDYVELRGINDCKLSLGNCQFTRVEASGAGVDRLANICDVVLCTMPSCG